MRQEHSPTRCHPCLRRSWRPDRSGDGEASRGADGTQVLGTEHEWLVTNGLGGYASGTLRGVPTRRYHGLFVPNLSEPKGRYVVVPRLDDCIDTAGRSVNLGGAEYLDGRAQVEGAQALREFRLDGMTPVWVFEVDGSVVERSIVMPHGRNAVCVCGVCWPVRHVDRAG